MKKLLIASTALAGMVAAPAAMADMSISAAATHGLIFVDTDKTTASGARFQDVKVVADYGIKFASSFELDNGLTVGFGVSVDPKDVDTPDTKPSDAVDFEGANVSLSGPFGVIKMGDVDSDAARMTPTAGLGGRLDGDMKLGLKEVGGAGAVEGTSIAYFTPSIAGLKAGISYGTDNAQDSVGNETGNDINEAAAVSALYSGDFGGFGVKLGASYLTVLESTESNEMSFGGGITFGDFGFDVAYADREIGTTDSSSFGLGASYSTGPWGIAANYQIDEQEGRSDDTTSINGEVSYAIGSGIKAVVQADSVDTGSSSGFAVGTLLKTSF